MTNLQFPHYVAGLCLAFAITATAAEPNTLSPEEKSAGWKILFDGKSMRNWQDPSAKVPPGDAWTIDDGCLKATKNPNITEDLVSAETYRDFELMWDWKLSPAANSGVKYKIQAFPIVSDRLTKPGTKRFEEQVEAAFAKNYFDRKAIETGDRAQIYVVGFEYQLIDNAHHADAQRGGKYQAGALYDILPPTSDTAKPIGEWNTSRLVVKGDHVEHWLNGTKVLDATLADPAVAASSAKRWGEGSPVYKLLTTHPKANAPFSLQNHGNEAWFRNIKVRRLK
jgi:hypothetical protein